VEHTFPCGHTGRITRLNAAKNKPRCWDCEQPLYAQRKLEERKAKRKAAPPRTPPPATAEQRQAQRQLVSMLNLVMIVDPDGVAVQRDDRLSMSHGFANSGEVTHWLDVLDIPYTVELVVHGRQNRKASFLIRVAWANLPALAKWAPTAARKAEKALQEFLATQSPPTDADDRP
jgi:hypothetical protein